jgi:hypothetical protein
MLTKYGAAPITYVAVIQFKSTLAADLRMVQMRNSDELQPAEPQSAWQPAV